MIGLNKKGEASLAIFLVISLVLSGFLFFGDVFKTTGFATFDGGDGSSGNPYQISTCVQLQGINDDSSANYILVSDVDCSDTINWNSGAGFLPLSAISGFLDGQDNSITGLYINRGSTNYVGLFSDAGSSVIRNLNLEANITGQDYVGAISGYFDGEMTVTNVHSNSIVQGRNSVGGILGQSDSYLHIFMNDSSSVGTVSGITNVGGLIGLSETSIYTSHSNASVSGTTYVGGFAGSVEAASGTTLVYDSYSLSNVTASDVVGGFIGSTSAGEYGFANISTSYSIGTVTSGGSDIGGFFGQAPPNTICSNIFWDTQSSGMASDAPSAVCNAVGKTTAQMKTQATFTSWDFSTVWEIVEGVTYPTLIPPNTAPSLSQVFISPNSSVSQSDSLKGYCNSTDSDADDVTYYYNWYLNGVLNSSGLTSSQTQSELINVNNVSSVSKGQNWTLECTSYDGTENSTAVNSTTVTVGNTAPVVSNVAISPSPIHYTDGAECTYTFSDADSDSDSSTIKWYVNNQVLRGETSSILDSSKLTRGYPVYCSVTGNDGAESIAPVNSETLTVQGSSGSAAPSLAVQELIEELEEILELTIIEPACEDFSVIVITPNASTSVSISGDTTKTITSDKENFASIKLSKGNYVFSLGDFSKSVSISSCPVYEEKSFDSKVLVNNEDIVFYSSISNAQIFVSGEDYSNLFITDSEGFSSSTFSPGSYDVLFYKDGYSSIKQSFSI